MFNEYLPIEWYIAKIHYLETELRKLPVARFGCHRGKEIIRIYSGKRRQISAKNSDWKNVKETTLEARIIREKIRKLKADLQRYHNVNYDEVKSKMIIKPNTVPIISMNTWNELKDNECGMENPYDYNFQGHLFRSRFEMSVAEELAGFGMGYKYDFGMMIDGRKNFFDMAVPFPEFNCFAVLEVLGLMGDQGYVGNKFYNLQKLVQIGFLPERDVFLISGENKYMPNPVQIRLAILNMVRQVCSRYVQTE